MTAMTCSATSWGYPHLDAPWNAGSSRWATWFQVSSTPLLFFFFANVVYFRVPLTLYLQDVLTSASHLSLS